MERDREREMALTDVLEHVDHEEWRDQVIDALHVAAGRVADGPNEQDALKNLTQTHTHKTESQNSALKSKHIHITQRVHQCMDQERNKCLRCGEAQSQNFMYNLTSAINQLVSFSTVITF